jgi:hypothetical protein
VGGHFNCGKVINCEEMNVLNFYLLFECVYFADANCRFCL